MGRHRKKRSQKQTEAVIESNVESGFEEIVDYEPEESTTEGSFENNGSKKRSLEQKIEPGTKKGKLENRVTIEELSAYKGCEAGQHSFMLKMQLVELLKEMAIKEKHKVMVNKWKNSFSQFISSMKSSKNYKLNDISWMDKDDIKLPLPMFSSSMTKISGKFVFSPPTSVKFVGSYASNLLTTQSRIVDIALILNKNCMDADDLSNYQWILKRVLYLCWLGKALKNNKDLVSEITWIYQCGSSLRPVLQITPGGPLGKKWKFNIFPVPPEDYFTVAHISPLENNVRQSLFSSNDTATANDVEYPTPNYNWACAVDVLMIAQNKVIEENLNYSHWNEGIKLFKIWMSQRNLIGPKTFSSHFICLLVIHMIKNRKINLQFSSYQVFRTMLLAFVQSDWNKSGLTLFDGENSKDENEVMPTVSDFHKFYPVVFVDPTGYLNLASSLHEEDLLEIKHEAEKSVKFLETSSINLFELLFIRKIDFHMNFDQVLHLTLNKETVNIIFGKHVTDADMVLVDHLGDKRNAVRNIIMSTLTKAFSDRVNLISCHKAPEIPLPFGKSPKSTDLSLTIGLLLNQATFCSVLTKGPSAEMHESKEFREFWGDLSNLRRFQDSSFHEAVLWCGSNTPVADKRLLMGKIAKYILNHQLRIKDKRIHVIDKQLENVIRMPAYPEELNYGTGEEANRAAILAFDSLTKKLRSLELVLPVSSIQSSSEVMRFSQVFPPISKAVSFAQNDASVLSTKVNVDEKYGCRLYRSAIEVQIFLELSGKWPDDLIAIKAMKTKFLQRVQELLNEDGISSVLHPTHLLISWEGFIFRVKLCYRREIYLHRIIDLPNREYKEEETEASIALEKEIELIPKLASSLNSLQSEYPSFSGSVRLVKRWCCSQMLVPLVPSILIDLLVAYLYVHPFPYDVPSTPHVSLLRFFSLMCFTDWKITPIILNFRNELSDVDRTEILKRFNNKRSQYPSIFIATPFELRKIVTNLDPTDLDFDKRFRLLSCWSRPNPHIVVLNRVKGLAEIALLWYQNNVLKANIEDFKTLFRPSLKDYDVLIHLKHKEIARRRQNLNFTKEVKVIPYKYHRGEMLPPVEFDPVQYYLKELREHYKTKALFFYDDLGGETIGVVWKPSSLEVQDAKINAIKGHKLIGVNDVKQVANIDAFIEDFKILGNGLIKEVTLRDK